MTDIYVLRKSVDSYSAGTRVDVAEQPGKTRTEVTVTPHCYNSNAVIVPTNLLVKLRPRTAVVPLRNRAVRRAEKRRAQAVLDRLLYHE